MKTVGIQEANLRDCLNDARREGVVITRRGKPVVLLVGVEGLDLEQIELGHSDKFWRLVRKWRRQKTISRAELEKRLANTK